MKLIRVITSKTFLSFFITAVFISIIVWRVDWSEIEHSFRQFNPLLIVPAILINLSTFIFRAFRWQVFLKDLKHISFFLNFKVIMIGWTANNLLPARLGEFVRAYVMGKQANISRSASLATILVERIFDGLILVLFLLILIQYFQFPEWVQNLGLVGAVLFGGVFLILFLMRNMRKSFLSLTARITGRILPSSQGIITELSEKFIRGLETLLNPRRQVIVLFYTLLIWSIETLNFKLIMNGFQIDISWAGTIFTVIIVNLGIIIPSSPGYIGTFQFFAILALSIFQVNPGTALSFAVVLHAVQYLPVTLIGLVMMNRLGLRWSELKRAS